MMKNLQYIFAALLLFSCSQKTEDNSFKGHNLEYTELARLWDEAIPLGNGMVGNLVWEKKGKLRFSLDRADLWDLRPMANIDFDKWKFDDVYEHWQTDQYEKVQEAFDVPYNQLPAPSKIPAGALEFDVQQLGEVKSISLDIETAMCRIEWTNGTILTTFVHAEKPIGWYKFEHLSKDISVSMQSPAYNRENEEVYTSQSRNDLNQLGYQQGEIIEGVNELTYNQKGWEDFSYQIYTAWESKENRLLGCWSISAKKVGWKPTLNASEVVEKEKSKGFETAIESHLAWWKNYWSRSSIEIPDSILQRQYYLEMYKFGSAARADVPPISLQAVWTADHGKLPPWKGDFHHDLNTQLSYWPAYAGNHLELEKGFINWLWKYRPTFKKYTQNYFEAEGLNVPGVSTLEGEPMGGWIQYSFGQTVAAWLSHHFYLHWQFTQDRDFLEEKAYPWLKDVSIFLEDISVLENGKRKLKMSSSPEIFHNSREAWFVETTNFDLALIRWNLAKTVELAKELELRDEAEKWSAILSEWPELAVDTETGLMFAPGFPYNESHRHFSHLMAFHPLNLIDYSNGETDQQIINHTLNQLDKIGPDYWTGYSYSWQGNLYARAFEGNKAADALRIFAQCFCLKNSFHVNGDQCKAGHSTMTYRPFTLEGNFAFASAIQEMLIQSHSGIIRIFPAIPDSWSDVKFEKLRTYGAFLVSAQMLDYKVNEVRIYADADGTCSLFNPFEGADFQVDRDFVLTNNVISLKMKKGESVIFRKN